MKKSHVTENNVEHMKICSV